MISEQLLNNLIEQKDIPFGLNQARREISLFEIICEKESISVSSLAHLVNKYTTEIEMMLRDLQDYQLIKIINRREHIPHGDHAVDIPYKHIIITDLGKDFGELLKVVCEYADALRFIKTKRTDWVVPGEIADKLGIDDDKDIINDFESSGIIGFHDGAYLISNIGERLADLLSDSEVVDDK